MPISMIEYLNKCTHIQISDKDMKEKISKDISVPANVKEPQVLQNYIKEILTENKRILETDTFQHMKSP